MPITLKIDMDVPMTMTTAADNNQHIHAKNNIDPPYLQINVPHCCSEWYYVGVSLWVWIVHV